MRWPPDRDEFEALYREHYPAVFRFALYMTGDAAAAGEITQDVFVWLIHHSAEYDAGRGSLGAFLGGVARKFLHRRQRNERRWLPLHEGAAAHQDLAAGLERDQEAAQLHRAIAALPERYREAVVLCDLQGNSYDQAAAVMGCATGTVKSRLHRARELLAGKMQRSREGQRCL
ncbi:MAG TPA: RNA polymerase sigma factor [Candidatus Sulfopaludibacter sp.]|jgi:RNA polymerase sigma-70 factor (ECF subfamily)|nr:RNA polymerase sigma factor [Candidatus Sulfopaludibacter sp.]